MKKIRYIIAGLLLFATSGLMAQGYFNVTYNMAAPMGETKDYIDQFSARGFGLEGGYFVNQDLSVGMSISWNGFYKDFPWQTYEFEDGTGAITGKMWRYTNLYPWLVGVKYYIPTGIKFRPYAGLSLGTVIEYKTTDFGIYSLQYNRWAFGLSPEVGFLFLFNSSTGLTVNARYNYSTKTSDIPAQSNIGINVGLIWRLGSSEFSY